MKSDSGAGVVHYQLLHRPRSVPMALGPAPLVTAFLSSKSQTVWKVMGLLIIVEKKIGALESNMLRKTDLHC